MRTRTTARPTLEEGFQKFTQIKMAEMKSESKNLKEKQMMIEVEQMWKALSHQDKCRWTSKNITSGLKETPLKKKTIKVKQTKAVPATSSTAKKNSSSKKMEEAEAQEQLQMQGMNEVSKNLFADKSKKIKKQSKKNTKTLEYQNFYKFHFAKLKQEHPNWASDKITQIISLLWKKRKIEIKCISEKEVEEVYQKIMNGKEAFKEFKVKSGVNEKQIDGLWNRLPVESKRTWQLQGNGLALQKSNKKKGKMNLNQPQQPIKPNQFSFLQKVM